MFLQFWPNAGDKKHPPYPDMVSIPKLIAGGCLTEMLVFTGWLINGRRFIVALPPDKCKAWQDQINEIYLLINVPYKMVGQMVGRLNHAACIIPEARHFMNRLRMLDQIANKRQSAKVMNETRKDSRFWKSSWLRLRLGHQQTT